MHLQVHFRVLYLNHFKEEERFKKTVLTPLDFKSTVVSIFDNYFLTTLKHLEKIL